MSVNRESVPGPPLESAPDILIPAPLDGEAVRALVREKLQRRCWPDDRPIPIWARSEADLEAAEANALVGVDPPPDPYAHSLRGFVKRFLVKFLFRLMRPITRTQSLFNNSVLKCLDALMAWAYEQGEVSALADQVAHLEAQLAQQEVRLRELEQLLFDKRVRKAA